MPPPTPTTTLKPTRPSPFTHTQKRTPITTTSSLARTLSAASTASTTSTLTNNTTGGSITSASSILASQRKLKTPLSSETRTRYSQRPANAFGQTQALPTLPGTPTKKASPFDRPKTPCTPRDRDADLHNQPSEMDVSRVDPEDVLVASESVEPEAGDISAEVDDAWVRSYLLDLQKEENGKEDKVVVSVRIRPTDAPSAWTSTPTTVTLASPSNTNSTANQAPPTTYTFDSIHTGSLNKPLYTSTARAQVAAAMEGYNAVVFAYGQTASGKTFTLTGTPSEPGIIPRALRDVFAHIRRTPNREYLLRCSYLEIYNETVHDLLGPTGGPPVQIVGVGGKGDEVILVPLREEVVVSLKGVKEVLRRGEGHRRTACTDWNDRSSRSHSVFRLVIESRERGGAEVDGEVQSSASSNNSNSGGRQTPAPSGRQTPGLGGRQTPGLSGRMTPGGVPPPTPGGARLQARGGRSVQTSVLSLIDLAGSEKATSDKERTREGKYINTSLLTLGTVIGTLAENASKGKNDHVPYRNSKLTRLLQPSLAGNARISVICTINPDVGAVGESTSTLLFAKRIKNVQLNAKKKEVVDTDALIERYRKEIEDLKSRLAEREAEAPVRKRRLSAREQIDESKAMGDLNARIQQLTRLILTSQTVDDVRGDGDESRPASPVKIDFDMSPYQLQQELLSARLQLESQGTQILSLEAALLARPALPTDAPDSEKDRLLLEQAKTIRELEIVVRGYEDNLAAPLRSVREDVEREWEGKLKEEKEKREEGERWAGEVVKELEREKKMRTKLEEERRALAAFVSKFDSLGLGGLSAPISSKLSSPLRMPSTSGSIFPPRKKRISNININDINGLSGNTAGTTVAMAPVIPMMMTGDASPMRLELGAQPSLLEEEWLGDVSFEGHLGGGLNAVGKGVVGKSGLGMGTKEVLAGKENLPL